MNAFDTFKMYLAFKQHFQKQPYDYFKYNGKVNVKPSTFDSRKDKYLFQKLSKKKDVEGFLVSNLIENNTTWIGDIITPEGESIYNTWLKRQQSITYVFENDIEKMDSNFNENLIVKDADYPFLLKLFLRKEIAIETLIIIDSILDIFSYWNKNIKETILWPDLYHKFIKYRPFVKYDKSKCKQLLKNRFI